MKTVLNRERKKLEILVVEDSPTQAEKLKYLLEEKNCNITLAANGKQAMAVLEKYIPDLIITDVVMPEMDGYELCQKIKEDEKLRNIPVILLTSLSDPEDVLKGLTFGADYFFTKPCEVDYLLNHINQILTNPVLNEKERNRDEVEIFFNGERRMITANHSQLLTLLLSTYEAAVMQNKQLHKTQEELKMLNENLEERVELRTKEVKEGMTKFLDLYNNTPTMFLSVETSTGCIIECNDTLLSKTGLTRSEIIGEQFLSLFHPGSHEKIKNNQKIFSVTGELENSEMELLTKLGGAIPVLLNASAVKDENGKILHSRTVLQDISMLVQAREQIIQSEERFRTVTDSAVDSIITVDEVGIIVGWNQGAKKTFGYNETEAIGNQVTILMPEFFVDAHSKGFTRVQKGGEPHVLGATVELKGKRKNGEVFPIELSLAQWFTQTDSFYTGIIRDITVRKQVEVELIVAKEKAEESDKLKTAFLANMSHEIRTPLNGILGFTQLLKEQGLEVGKKENYFGWIDQCSQQLLQIVTDIIDISKIEAGQDRVNPVVFNLPDFMEKIKLFFDPLAEKRNLTLTLKNELPDHFVNVICDSYKLRQALNNVIGNAIKFTETGGVGITISKNGNIVSFKIKDSGIGIDAGFHKLIFERFRQIEITATRKYGGTGLGLSLAKSYIEMLEGTIEVISSPGKGSTFTISVPLIQEEAKPDEKMEVYLKRPPPGRKKRTILLAEDEETNSFLIEAMLESSDINILFAVNGIEAVEMCKNDLAISLVLMDIKMPLMDGLTATRHIKSFRNGLPVIATTAFAYSDDKQKCMDAGCDGFLAKPIIKEELITMIDNYLI